MSGATFDEEAQMWQAALLDSESAETAVEPDRVWAAVRGDLPPEELAELVDRLAVDADLQVAWRLAVELQRTEEQKVLSPEVPKPANRAWWGLVALVAVALLAVLVVSRGPDDSHDVRGDGDIVTPIADRAPLSRSAFVLTWAQPVGAVATVELRRADLSEVAVSPAVEDGQWRVPEEALNDVRSGEELVWRVRVRVAGVTQTSPAFVVTVAD